MPFVDIIDQAKRAQALQADPSYNPSNQLISGLVHGINNGISSYQASQKAQRDAAVKDQESQLKYKTALAEKGLLVSDTDPNAQPQQQAVAQAPQQQDLQPTFAQQPDLYTDKTNIFGASKAPSASDIFSAQPSQKQSQTASSEAVGPDAQTSSSKTPYIKGLGYLSKAPDTEEQKLKTENLKARTAKTIWDMSKEGIAAKAAASQGRVDVMGGTLAQGAVTKITEEPQIKLYTSGIQQATKEIAQLTDPTSPYTSQKLDEGLVGYDKIASNAPTSNETRQANQRIKDARKDLSDAMVKYKDTQTDLRDVIPKKLAEFHAALENLAVAQNKATSDTAYRIFQSGKSAYSANPIAAKAFSDAYEFHKDVYGNMQKNPQQFDLPGVNSKVPIVKISSYASQHNIPYVQAAKIIYSREKSANASR